MSFFRGRRMAILACALLLSGCADTPATAPVPESSVTAPLPPSSGPPEPMDPSAWQNPRCGGEEWGTALGGVDAAAGTRYLALRVRNCSDDTLDLPRPTFVGYDSDGAVIELTADVDPLPTLRPDDVITMEMTWGGNGRCERGVQELVITLGDQHLSPDDRCLQLSGEFAPERDADIRVHFVVDDDSELS